MIRLVAACIAFATPTIAQDITVPSGVTMTLYDLRLDTDPPVARFRFVSTAIDPKGAGLTFVDLVDDLQWVCDSVVVPSLDANDWTGEQVVISVSNVETTFGLFDDTVTQFFQPYKLTDSTCMWEDF